MADNDVIYRHKKDSGVIYGIPARDLTQDDMDRLNAEQRRDVKAGTLYTAVGNGSDQGGNGPDLDAMTRPELNAYAANVGVENPDDLPNKDAVIDAIAAVKGDA